MEKSEKLFFCIVIVLTTLAVGTVIHAGVRNHRLDVEQGQLHCGEVEVNTPNGQKALEHQCWRAK